MLSRKQRGEDDKHRIRYGGKIQEWLDFGVIPRYRVAAGESLPLFALGIEPQPESYGFAVTIEASLEDTEDPVRFDPTNGKVLTKEGNEKIDNDIPGRLLQIVYFVFERGLFRMPPISQQHPENTEFTLQLEVAWARN